MLAKNLPQRVQARVQARTGFQARKGRCPLHEFRPRPGGARTRYRGRPKTHELLAYRHTPAGAGECPRLRTPETLA